LKSITDRAGVMFGVALIGMGVLITVAMLLMTDRPAPESLVNLLVAVVAGMLGYATRGNANNNDGG
jgi:hypothetical protein